MGERRIVPTAPPPVWGKPFGTEPDLKHESSLRELGRHLFFEPRLSANGCRPCSACHVPELAFTDGRARATGAFGDEHPRNTPTLTNVGYAASLTANKPGIGTLEEQAAVPMFNEHPPEMGLSRDSIGEVLKNLQADPMYRDLTVAATSDPNGKLTLDVVLRSLAAFERSLISYQSGFDRYVYDGDESGMSVEAKRGMDLFFSHRLACAVCHMGWNLSGPVRSSAQAKPEQRFHNVGIAAPTDPIQEFKVPTLRNIALTAPYMHDGSITTLSEVVEHYERGGGPNPNRSSILRQFTLSEMQRSDLIAFMHALTDEAFIERAARLRPTTISPSPKSCMVPTEVTGTPVTNGRVDARRH